MAQEPDKRDGGPTPVESPPGNMIGMGIAIGAGAGVALGVATDNLPLGIAIGAAIGIVIGAALEQRRQRHRSENGPPGPDTPEE